ncbi:MULTISPECIES: OpgC domain-containing protein [unclassified Burkholderia]|uniref:OpgC domain-containing protein n=1 Tax=unclassified Burkholderia TaxID=2613784 RepID=UPI000F55FD01|nr:MULTISPECIES: OpgC domain-containing protein [unclassified Burkholderia]RQR45050.1 OpgC domain-containing protein [Burkholderia sp. Bp9131]RQR76956.1 OpgC domain-containing protein [Burkholderia sp. Bp9015]RQR85810.1 OpgC domain-containing protein [Burkholderia sp. Bp9011]RQR95458.1 OpgC domain-containing protein [Burkholderia sp. Bp9010]RQS00782.1 OpgC domain-containing protein [Burkholderia sp. Bp8994]
MSLNTPPAVPMPPTRSARLIEVDFFRGIVLLMIVVDHIGASVLSRVTLHAFALCDAAEVFVFLGGFATASAYGAIADRHGARAAQRRFVRRAMQIYRAFLATSTLMLVVSAVLDHYGIDTPNLALDDVSVMLASPLTGLAELLTFQRQPYLASVLPMYVLFALASPVIVPFARRHPWLLVAFGATSWLAAGWLGPELLDTDAFRWNFNPFAWQLMFVAGVLARCQPFYRYVALGRWSAAATGVACAIVLGCASYKLFSGLPLPEGILKRDLALPRIVSFAAIAWLMADCVRYGWIARIARAVQPVVAVGRRGLICFVAGAAISLVIDSLLHPVANGAELRHIGVGLAADACAVGLMMAVAGSGTWFARRRGAAA